MTDLFTYALIAIATIGWLLAVGAFRLIDRQSAIVDALERRCTSLDRRVTLLVAQLAEQSRDLTYRRQRQCSLVREMLDAKAETQRLRMTYEPPASVIVDLPAHITHNPSDWGLN